MGPFLGQFLGKCVEEHKLSTFSCQLNDLHAILHPYPSQKKKKRGIRWAEKVTETQRNLKVQRKWNV